MSIKEERCWAGSEASYETAMEAEIKIAAGSFDKEDESEPHRLMAVSDGLAVITIKGPLVKQ
ncbi:MAG: hypothetical protein IPO40_25030 [Fibrobacteres bacterium]|nr:hypothetical protein [Fibrobacterota bacterium]